MGMLGAHLPDSTAHGRGLHLELPLIGEHCIGPKRLEVAATDGAASSVASPPDSSSDSPPSPGVL